MNQRQNRSPMNYRPKVSFNYRNSPLYNKQNSFEVYNKQPEIYRKQNIQLVCTQCHKNMANYYSISNEQLCSQCGLNRMKQGKQIIAMSIKTQNKKETPLRAKQNDQSNIFQKNQIKNEHEQRSSQLIPFLTQIKQQLVHLNQQQDQNENGEQRIKQYYQQRRNMMKKHYQRIKMTIKSSIEQDLQVLQQSQQTDLIKLNQNHQNSQQQIEKLQQIRDDIEPNLNKIIYHIDGKNYKQLMQIHQKQAIAIIKKNHDKKKKNNLKELNKNKINTQLYSINTYTLTENNQSIHKENKSIIFSFQQNQ